MKLKLFSSKAGNRKPNLEGLENEVNAWLDAHPNVTIENTHEVSHPNMSWSHLTLAVWYSE
ncbi:hypothetical protein [Ilumatobacter coccineus]|jgi:hypothetical protein|uniref:Uncharacterized protein n=1 Tax=Ilumatobacter coccineus (strain NBRC 103263 / KCTC 29153 / YM16-304) TaxID=1313172 RepID=A0A6C7EF63_ILUCY|nr:hypothetical protein [Ilumatobacter coccineus]BAN03268.1 hypothetical protein YM304_29540 [Ilumatobacter coccineus YM16-304]